MIDGEINRELQMFTGAAKDKYTCSHHRFAIMKFSEAELRINIGADSTDSYCDVTKLSSYTIYELENLSEALRYVARGELDRKISVPSRDILLGPTIKLGLALRLRLGGTLFYCSTRSPVRAGRTLVDLEALNAKQSACATFEIQEASGYAEKLYEIAKDLAEKFITPSAPYE